MAAGKVVMVILDGLGDLPVPALADRTPLETAFTPVLDAWVDAGQCGLVDPIAPGVYVDTQTGVAALMGMRPEEAHRLARGPIEAAGIGLELGPGDIAFRGNFATLEPQADGFTVSDRRAGRITEGVEDLAAELNTLDPFDGVTSLVQPLRQHRIVLRLSGTGLSAAITDTDPGTTGMPQTLRWARALREGDEHAERTARAVNVFTRRAREVLSRHPVNDTRREAALPAASGVLFRGAGDAAPLQSFVQDRGLRGAIVSADRTVLGLGVLHGYTPVVEPSFTGLTDTDLDGKVRATLAALEEHDIVWLHVKGTDIAAHDLDAELKTRFLEQIDTALAPLGSCGAVVGVSADHTTDSNTGCHTGDPVPTLIHAPGGRHDGCKTFDERICMGGGLGRLTAYDYLNTLLDAGRPELAPPTTPSQSSSSASSSSDAASPDAPEASPPKRRP